jgi:hypothetical protein
MTPVSWLWAASMLAPSPAGSTLSWDAPAGCPTSESVRTRIEALLDGPISAPRDVEIDARAVVTAGRPGSDWRLALEIGSESGLRRRELTAASCDELAQVTALLVAVAIDPSAAGRVMTEDDPDPSPPAPAPADPAPARTPAPTASPEPRSSPRAASSTDTSDAPSAPASEPGLGGAVRLAAGLGLGVVPSPAGALAGAVALRGRVWRVDLGASHRFVRPVPEIGIGTVTARVWATAATIDAAWVPAIPRVEFPLGIGVEAGAIAGRSAGLDAPRRGRGGWAALRGGAGLVILPWQRVGITVDARIFVPVTRTRFAIADVGVVHGVGPVGGQFVVGLETRWAWSRLAGREGKRERR